MTLSPVIPAALNMANAKTEHVSVHKAGMADTALYLDA